MYFPQEGEIEQMFYFIRSPGAVITVETFELAIQVGAVQGDAIQRLLHDMISSHVPPLALSTYMEKSIKDSYTREIHCYLTSLTGWLYQRRH